MFRRSKQHFTSGFKVLSSDRGAPKDVMPSAAVMQPTAKVGEMVWEESSMSAAAGNRNATV